jgi:hypothetical protein
LNFATSSKDLFALFMLCFCPVFRLRDSNIYLVFSGFLARIRISKYTKWFKVSSCRTWLVHVMQSCQNYVHEGLKPSCHKQPNFLFQTFHPKS